MSTLNNIFNDLLSLFFPAQCIACNTLLEGRSEMICTRCRGDIPLTYFHFDPENPMSLRLKAIHPNIEMAAAWFFYTSKGRWRQVIHEFKYRRSWHTAYKVAYWYGFDLLESPYFQSVDVVVPVPLHTSRLLKRRYNQSEMIAQGVADAMEISINRRSLRRHRNNPSQVTRSKKQRWNNVQGIFSVHRPELLEGKHILLVDDVFTTGATIISCVEALMEAIPSCRISVATLAVSQNEIIGNII